MTQIELVRAHARTHTSKVKKSENKPADASSGKQNSPGKRGQRWWVDDTSPLATGERFPRVDGRTDSVTSTSDLT
ncbi:hypothetical protein L596_008704 [Steinernema carpocapsae]|uniref:Uncharacterized protein n=1 Tax=Steinernema carpocapsae TaxID=34508 RepID=A0A4U5PDT4_STECR|nr:hypothetical protein L596_008704 [Steinernema carpocapsae]